MPLIHALSGTPSRRPDTSVHVAPPSRETCRLPSALPTYSTPSWRGDSAMAESVG